MDEVKQYSWHQKVSIKQAFAIVMAAVCMIIALCSGLVLLIVDNQNLSIRQQYDSYFTTVQLSNGDYYEYQNKEITGLDGLIYNQPIMVMAVLITIIVITVAISGGRLYYNWKLRKPLEILADASEKITANNLNFHIEAQSRDELGNLCELFEKMRASLTYYNKRLWYSAEESKRLNAAFAHDLRTPLTVLQGYGEMIEKGISAHNLSEAKMLSIAGTMNRQILRLKNYVGSMSGVQKLEEIDANRQTYSLINICKELKSYAQIIAENYQLIFKMPENDRQIYIDMKIVAEVFGNLVANAIRHAKTTVRIEFSLRYDELAVIVADDGDGFSENALKRATEPYYRDNEDLSEHLGMGLYICDILCEKHGGKLVISNGKNGGAKLFAIFSVKVDK
ncbi:MAG: HAMP domain-containing sensor histidine kinase [Lachnospiraceae bacterium]